MEWCFRKFEELHKRELYEILRFRTLVFVVEQNCPYDECDGKDYDSIHLFTENNGNIVGYARILPPGLSFDEASIGRVAINKSYRGRGLAKQIMLKSIDYIKENFQGIPIKIEAQEYLMKFYSELGFRPVSDVFMLDNIPHIEMVYKV